MDQKDSITPHTKLKTTIFLKGITQLALGKAIGVTPSRVSLWANGWEPVPVKWRRRIAEVLGVPESKIFKSETKTPGGSDRAPKTKLKGNDYENKYPKLSCPSS